MTKIRGIGQTRLTLPVEEPALWDAEHPNLYLLKAGVEEGGRLLETVEIPVGFRQIHYGGRDGTDPSCVYINGREIKLRGVCRHDVSPERGRSTTREEDWQEILAYRDANINHIRTSHYPPSRHLLEACDRLGMYVEEENGACFQGANGYDVHASAEDFLNPFKEMVQRDYNHPSVIIWSLGNESSFERTEGYRMEYDYIKEKDPGRPVIFSYPYTVETAPLPYDICSRHYESFEGVLGSPDMPVLHDEFAHISCYNLQELQADPNVRNHWGSSLQKAWEKLFTTRGALGADLWCSIDDVFMLPETVKNRWQTHSAGRWTGYGPWGSVLDCHRRLKPEAYLTKKAFSPIRLDPRTAIVQGDTLLIPVKNWFDHTNLRELELSCRADGQELPGQSLPEVEPHGEGVLILRGDWSRWTEVSLSFRLAGREIDSFCIRLKKPRPLCFWNSLKAPRLEETPEALRIYSGETVFTFSRRDACLDSVSFRETRVISGGPHLHLKGVDLGRWMGNRTPLASVDGNRVTVVLQGHYGDLIRLQYLFRIYGDGYFTVEYHMHSCQVDAGKVSEVGLRFDLAQEAVKICWEKESLYSVYPGDHIGRNSGTAERFCPQALEAGYGVRNPQWGWKDDMYDAFLFGEDDPAGGRATRDFLAMRENIRSYGVKSATGEGTLTVLGEGDTAVRLGDRNSLIVNQQWYYPQLGWGNDSGRPVTLPAAGARGATAIHVGEHVGCPEDF